MQKLFKFPNKSNKNKLLKLIHLRKHEISYSLQGPLQSNASKGKHQLTLTKGYLNEK